MHAPNLAGQNFEGTLSTLFAAQGFKAMPVMRLIRAADETASGRRMHRNLCCPARADTTGKKMVDFVLEADPGHYNPIYFPTHDASLPIRIAIEAKSQQVSGSADEKLVGTYLRMKRLPEGFTHKLLVTDIPAASAQAVADLQSIFRGQGLADDDGFGVMMLKANTNRFQWLDVTPFTEWMICAFPRPGARVNMSKTPVVFTPK